ncbi:sulfite exporter TauE/SafE family protein [Singulisphaera acidiphila]|uniref:Probable membrane transporter protein n=1 Tax=Singulisphaera acidiphila (strain ATCC BAA-1392 / DSM 18658 / VKM B-2454 / MOB10) TaxID=886293 RepID=L0D959_SINAD|nr:sulfite exporter TauE/SafE family protein [Singulisphaera acidiphila]AGA25919.1 putative permease [Singulisphaera acidiphila DSM 18658]
MSGLVVAAAGLLLGLGAGVLGGMFGIGGGLIIVPALILFFHDSPKTAIGTPLFALIWPAGLLGVVEYWKTGHVRPVQGAWIAVGFLLGGYLGARITLSIPVATVKRGYAVFLLIVGVYFLFSASSESSRPLKMPPLNPATDPFRDQVH